MLAGLFSPHWELRRAARWSALSSLRERSLAADMALLAAAGAFAAVASVALDFGLRLPGHAILRATVPLAFGLALVPRRGGGSVMAIVAALCSLGLRPGAGAGGSAGALTSLLLLGPALDMALWRWRAGRGLAFRFMAAAISANCVALAVRLAAAAWLPDTAHGHRNLVASPWALASYVVWGGVAGAVSAAVFFRCGERRPVE